MTPHTLDLTLTSNGADRPMRFAPKRFIVAGWTSRDKAAMEHHMTELEALGIARPSQTPVFYRNSVTRLTPCTTLQTPGPGSSGEVEFVLFNIEGALWVGVGSDHTDREVEAYNITVSKQMCDKPIATRLWPLSDLRAHWDTLEIESRVVIDGAEVLYQQGTVAAMLHPDDLIAAFEAESGTTFGPGDVMMGGTLPAMGGVRPADHFACQLRNPATGATLSLSYDVEALENVG